MTKRSRSHPLRPPLAGVLLLLQTVAGGVTTLAHAGDAPTAPATTVEATHDARCPRLHDVQRCALCHYAGGHVVLHRATWIPSERAARARAPSPRPVTSAAGAPLRTARPRAPPFFLS
ncbi:MAG TPA: hypothetical protein VGQ25_11875 [Gemmatimonadales bacterium]|nr:hypothetical protein [Gemmatimonadales bacterium]